MLIRSRRLFTGAALLSFFLIALPVAAKKPPKPPPEPEDPCLSMESFSPDYVFYRDTSSRKGKHKNFKITVFLAESETGCEKALFDFPTVDADGARIENRQLKFSLVNESDGVSFGRVIWRSYSTGVRDAIWAYDFFISGTDVSPVEGVRQILIKGDYWNESIYEFDLSHDAATLAFQLYMKDPATDVHQYSIRMIDIAYCDAAPAACDFNDERAVVLAQTIPATDHDEILSDPAWGPLGSRIYFLHFKDDFYRVLRYVELDEGWENAQWPPSYVTRDLYSSEFEPEYWRMRALAGGIMGGEEYLAVEFPHEEINCGYIYFVNVQDCERVENPVCFTDQEFVGTHPSWTKNGDVIHHYYERTCSVFGGTIGIYDGANLDVLTDGYWTDAAGGLPD